MIVRMCACFVLLFGLAACSEPVPDKAPVEPVEPTQEELFKADMVMICDSVKQPQFTESSAEDRPMVLAKYIDAKLRSDRAKTLFESSATLAPDERSASFSAAAAEAGIEDCAFLGIFQAPPQEGEGVDEAPEAPVE